MVFSIKLPQRECLIFLILAAIYTITRLPLLFFLPLIRDEALYSIMVEEQVRSPTLIPTLFGYPVSWKPPLFFWVYSLFSQFPLPLEAVYRFPSFLFGLATLVPLYLILRNVGASRNVAFFSLVVFLFSFVSLYSNGALLTDTLLFFLISCSLYLYTEKKLGDWRFLAAGTFAFAAFFVKLVIVFMVPLLAVVYLYTRQRKMLRNPLFIVSLLAVPAAFVLHLMLLKSVGLAEELYLSDIGGHLLTGEGFLSQAKLAWGSMHMLITGAGIWFVLSLLGLWKHWRKNLFMTTWYVMILFPLVAGFFMPWYYLPVFPAVSYFAVMALLRWEDKENADALFGAFITLAIIGTVIMCVLMYSTLYLDVLPEKEAGLLLSGKENVMVVGGYAPGIIAYKMTTEYHSGEVLDVGWVVVTSNSTGESVAEFVQDYHTDKYPVVDGSFTSFFTNSEIFRKDTNIVDFDYVVLVRRNDVAVDGDSIYDKDGITIYKVN